MADQNLGRNYFPILRLTEEVEDGKEEKPLGYFSCRESTTRYLELTTKVAAANALVTFTRKAPTSRNLTLADGTILVKSAAGGEEKSSIGVKPLSRGNKPIKLITGKKIEGSSNKNAKHSVGFLFPSFATIQIISNALGLLLNADTVSLTPGAGQIYPFFISRGGKRYPIATSTAAKSAEVVLIATSPTGIEALVSEAGSGRKVEAAQPAAE